MEVLKIFSDQGSSASRSVLADEPLPGFFALFARGKKGALSGRQVSAELGGHVSSSMLTAHQMAHASRRAFWVDEAGGTWMRLPTGRWMLLGSGENVCWDEP